MVGKTGLEPVTPRLSSVCSNQLSYMPRNSLVERFCLSLLRGNLQPMEIGGAEEIRTPDILLAKQALYQLSYSPAVASPIDGSQPSSGQTLVTIFKRTKHP